MLILTQYILSHLLKSLKVVFYSVHSFSSSKRSEGRLFNFGE